MTVLGSAPSPITDTTDPAGPVESEAPSARSAWGTGPRAQQVSRWAAGVAAYFVVLRILWPAPLGVIIQGVIVGGLTALVAFGISLVWKANRVINFAQADLGVVPASLAITLMYLGQRQHVNVHNLTHTAAGLAGNAGAGGGGGGLSYWLALPLVLIVSLGLGYLIERGIIRRFSKAPRLILLVVTIGISQILSGLAGVVPFIFGLQSQPQSFTQPFSLSFTIHPIIFHANDLMALLAIAAVAAGLFGLLRYTSIGLAIRACAESADRAALLGINVGLTQSSVWVIAALLSGIAAFLRAGILGIPAGGFGPSLLMRALAAAAVGRMGSYPLMFAAAAGIGIIETSIIWDKGSATLVDPVLLVVVVAVFLFQRARRESRVTDQATSTWLEVSQVRAIPRELANLPEVRWASRALLVVLAAVLVALPAWLSVAHTNLAAAVCIYAIVAVSLVILTGWAGEVSLGQIGFVALGAAVSGTLNAHYHWDLVLTVGAAALVGVLAAVAVGLPALRIRGMFFSVTTLAFAIATWSFFLDRDYFHFLPDELTQPIIREPLLGKTGIASETAFYYVCLVALGIVLWAARGLRASRTSRVLSALRDNERAVQAFGLNPAKEKLTAFALSGFFAAFAGGLLAIHQRAVGQQIFAPVQSIRALSMVVVGGLGSIPGALFGTLFVKSTEWFSSVVPENFRFLVVFAGSGAGLVLVLMVLPGGLGAVLYRLRDRYLRAVAARRGVLVPSMIADSAEPGVDRIPAGAARADAAPAGAALGERPGRSLPVPGLAGLGALASYAGLWWRRVEPPEALLARGRLVDRLTKRSPEARHRGQVRQAYLALVLNVVFVAVNLAGGKVLLAVFTVFGLAQAGWKRVALHIHRDVYLERARLLAERSGRVVPGSGEGDAAKEGSLLSLRGVDVSYGQVQVLFGVDLDVAPGEVIALLGTNGAGKSTVLRAVSGLVAPGAGRIWFDGTDVTSLAPQKIAAMGIAQVPGGRGVFPSLSVEENLKVAGWLRRGDRSGLAEATDQVLELFPILKEKYAQPAAMLSGGQQQMLTLGMAFLGRPRLLMIDELSLGLAPAIVAQLLDVVRALRDQGTTVILVEQSVNVALTVAETAYFMEKGEIRFHGPTSDLLSRPDVLRSVYLQGAASHAVSDDTANGKANGKSNGKAAATNGRTPARPRRSAKDPAQRSVVALETVGVTKSFTGVRAIDDLSIRLHEGEILGIIGPNGAGKTTFFDLLSGFLAPDAGTISLFGTDITATGADLRARLGLGRSFQDARLFSSLTVHQAVAVALDRQLEVRDPVAAAIGLPQVTEAERRHGERVDELIELTGIGAFRDKFVSELSTGSRRIVDLACQIGMAPKVILFDEPSSGIAQRETEALGPLLLGIRRDLGASLIVIEHDMPLLSSISDRLVALDLGHKVTEGRPADVLEHPEVVASYLGSSREVIERSGPQPAPARKSRRKVPAGAA